MGLRRLLPALMFVVVFAVSYVLLRDQITAALFDQPQTATIRTPTFSVLMIGWDGSYRPTVKKLLAEGKLPHLKTLVDSGSFIDVEVKDGRTDTKAGWAQIFSGYSSEVTGVESNRDYRPIPKGYTIFERLKDQFGSQIATIFISGKINNIGARGPHKVCINCRSRFDGTNGKTGWWDEAKNAPTKRGEKRVLEDREGEPYFNALPALDKYITALGPAPEVMNAAKRELGALNGVPFFAFIHFEEPDEQGHQFSESSKEYLSALQRNDENLAELLRLVTDLEVSEKREIKVFVLSDHGFDPGQFSHKHAPDTFWAVRGKKLRGAADRRDFTPTLLELYGFNLKDIEPALNGRSLLQ